MKKKIIIASVVIIVIALVLYFTRKRKKDEHLYYPGDNYEGDNYEGSKYYVGDKDFYENDKGRKVATAVHSSLYRVIKPAHKLKYEYNSSGNKTLIKLSPDGKPDLKEGSQLRIIKASEEKPMDFRGHDFVQTVYGNFVRADKIKKIRD